MLVCVLGIWFAGEARCYALSILLATLQGLAFLRLIDAPSLKRAFVWSTLGGLAILTQYHSGILIAAEGLCYLVIMRRRALAHIAAVAPFLPVAAWIVWHLPTIIRYSRPEAAWYGLLIPTDLLHIVALPLGAPEVLLQFLSFSLIAALLTRGRPAEAPQVAARPFVILLVTTAAAACNGPVSP